MTNTTKQHKGIVKWYNARKGYGLVALENSTDDLFFETNNRIKITQGCKVACEINFTTTGMRVTDIITVN